MKYNNKTLSLLSSLFLIGFISFSSSAVNGAYTDVLGRGVYRSRAEKEELCAALGARFHQGFQVDSATQRAMIGFSSQPDVQRVLKEHSAYRQWTENHKAMYSRAVEDRGILDTLEIVYIGPEKGYGVFAGEDIYEKRCIGIYSGEIKLNSCLHAHSDTDYGWSVASICPGAPEVFIDAKRIRNETAFCNASEENNNARIGTIVTSSGYGLPMYIAKRNIRKGEEVTISYGQGYWKSRSYQNTTK